MTPTTCSVKLGLGVDWDRLSCTAIVASQTDKAPYQTRIALLPDDLDRFGKAGTNKWTVDQTRLINGRVIWAPSCTLNPSPRTRSSRRHCRDRGRFRAYRHIERRSARDHRATPDSRRLNLDDLLTVQIADRGIGSPCKLVLDTHCSHEALFQQSFGSTSGDPDLNIGPYEPGFAAAEKS